MWLLLVRGGRAKTINSPKSELRIRRFQIGVLLNIVLWRLIPGTRFEAARKILNA